MEDQVNDLDGHLWRKAKVYDLTVMMMVMTEWWAGLDRDFLYDNGG